MRRPSRTNTGESHHETDGVGWCYYALSVLTLVSSLAAALHYYPGSFDWQYTVVSALLSKKHNPDGGMWFAAGLGLAMLWLWPFASRFWGSSTRGSLLAKWSVIALRIGIFFGTAMAIESILTPKLPAILEKTHEILAVLAFLFFYVGILGLFGFHTKRGRAFIWPALVMLLPIIAICISQLSLYLSQRDLGWVDHSWRDEGVPVWQSMAFWQWLSLGTLWAGIGFLAWMNVRRK